MRMDPLTFPRKPDVHLYAEARYSLMPTLGSQDSLVAVWRWISQYRKRVGVATRQAGAAALISSFENQVGAIATALQPARMIKPPPRRNSSTPANSNTDSAAKRV
jgi:hypothetical protein